MKNKKPKLKTVETYKKLVFGKYALYAGTFAFPLVPATIITIVNWDEWFAKSSTSLPFGFASMLVTVILAIIGILNSGTILKKAEIALYILAGLFICVGITNLFLASLLVQVAYVWLAVGAGLVGSGTCAVVEKKVFEPNIKLYKKLIKDNNLDYKSKREKAREEQARKDAELDAQYQAVE